MTQEGRHPRCWGYGGPGHRQAAKSGAWRDALRPPCRRDYSAVSEGAAARVAAMARVGVLPLVDRSTPTLDLPIRVPSWLAGGKRIVITG
jgi:hypothetical protein